MKSLFVIISCLVILLTPEITFGQKTSFSIGGEIALPGSSSGLSMNAGTGFGGSLRVESSWSKHISGLATIGYLAFAQTHPYSTTPTTTSKVKAILIQAGLKYYPREKKESPKGFFISAELGIMPTTTHFTYAANPDLNFKETGFSCAPGIGYQLGHIESSFRIQYNLTASGFNVYYYNFRLAYSFLKRKDKN
ncbi:MAG: outer membrane beta-barrel protein [Flavisolibacter sp.]